MSIKICELQGYIANIGLSPCCQSAFINSESSLSDRRLEASQSSEGEAKLQELLEAKDSELVAAKSDLSSLQMKLAEVMKFKELPAEICLRSNRNAKPSK